MRGAGSDRFCPGWFSSITLLLISLTVGGCASRGPSAPTESRPTRVQAPAPSDQRAAVPAALLVERQWLQSWFDGTPVRIIQRDDRSISVDVPSEYCFDPGKSRIKPALAAVLDKVAQSLERMRFAHVPLIAAPDDAAGKRSLALRRAGQVQSYLRSRGVAADRLGTPMASSASAVQLRIDVEEP